MKKFQCCATCIHFSAKRNTEGMQYFCKRLGYETKTHYVFNCWSPKKHIKKLMENQKDDH